MSKKLTSALVFFFKMLAAIPYADASGRYPNFPTEKTRYSFDADCLQPVTSSVGALGATAGVTLSANGAHGTVSDDLVWTRNIQQDNEEFTTDLCVIFCNRL